MSEFTAAFYPFEKNDMVYVTVSNLNELTALTRDGQHEFQHAFPMLAEQNNDDNKRVKLDQLARIKGPIRCLDLDSYEWDEQTHDQQCLFGERLAQVLNDRRVLSLAHNTTNYECVPELPVVLAQHFLTRLAENQFLTALELGFTPPSLQLVTTLSNTLLTLGPFLTTLQLNFGEQQQPQPSNEDKSAALLLVAPAVVVMTELRRLDLHAVTPLATQAICQSLLRSRHLEALILSVAPSRDEKTQTVVDTPSDVLVPTLAQLLLRVPRLTKLELRAEIDDDSFAVLMQAIKERDGPLLWKQEASLFDRLSVIQPVLCDYCPAVLCRLIAEYAEPRLAALSSFKIMSDKLGPSSLCLMTHWLSVTHTLKELHWLSKSTAHAFATCLCFNRGLQTAVFYTDNKDENNQQEAAELLLLSSSNRTLEFFSPGVSDLMRPWQQRNTQINHQLSMSWLRVCFAICFCKANRSINPIQLEDSLRRIEEFQKLGNYWPKPNDLPPCTLQQLQLLTATKFVHSEINNTD